MVRLGCISCGHQDVVTIVCSVCANWFIEVEVQRSVKLMPQLEAVVVEAEGVRQICSTREVPTPRCRGSCSRLGCENVVTFASGKRRMSMPVYRGRDRDIEKLEK